MTWGTETLAKLCFDTERVEEFLNAGGTEDELRAILDQQIASKGETPYVASDFTPVPYEYNPETFEVYTSPITGTKYINGYVPWQIGGPWIPDKFCH